MFARRGCTTDELGMPESLDEILDGLPVRTHHTYKLKFTKKRKELFEAIHKHSITLGMNPLKYFTSSNFKVDNQKEAPHKENTDLFASLQQHGVIDFQVIPDQTGTSFTVRLVMNVQQGYQTINEQELCFLINQQVRQCKVTRKYPSPSGTGFPIDVSRDISQQQHGEVSYGEKNLVIEIYSLSQY
ncbi:hypothetical protein FGO68_gene4559 [Halteria grandinella]|uniref:Uncharacterized protein n=1 Tax=Halteria grandinella TaxID=5974 RepID=A0A8J8NBD2_HALGN|nr:hypothetical protein FGO68_gene4559 [Halteria grandinella]